MKVTEQQYFCDIAYYTATGGSKLPTDM